MESRLIFAKSEHLGYLVNWEETPGFGWIYCGAKGEVKYSFIQENINDFFSEGNAFVALSRKGSFKCSKEILLESIRDLIGVYNFSVWNDNFTKTIEFNNIGVFRKGVYRENHIQDSNNEALV